MIVYTLAHVFFHMAYLIVFIYMQPRRVQRHTVIIMSFSYFAISIFISGNTEETMIFHQRKIRFHPDKSNQWLGVSLDVDPVDQSSVLVSRHLRRQLRGVASI